MLGGRLLRACLQVVQPAGKALGAVQEEFQAAESQQQRLQLLQGYAAGLPSFPEERQTFENRVMGCTAQVGLASNLSIWVFLLMGLKQCALDVQHRQIFCVPGRCG